MKIAIPIFAAALLTGCGSSSDPIVVNPLATVSDDATEEPIATTDPAQESTSVPTAVIPEPTSPTTSQPEPVTTTQPEPTQRQEPLAECAAQGAGYGWENGQSCIYPEIEEVTPEATPVEPIAEPEPTPVEPITQSEPESVVYATPDQFYSVPMICSYNDTERNGIQPDEFYQFTINENGTYVGNSIPFRFESTDAWSYAEGILYLSGSARVIGDGEVTSEDATCVPEEVEVATVEPIPEPEPLVVYAALDPLFGVPMICDRGPVPAGSQPTEFMRVQINEDGTYVTSSIPNRTGESTNAWSYAEGVVYLSGSDWTIDGDTLTRNESTCYAEEVETVAEVQTSVTFDSSIGVPWDCVIYGEQEGLIPHTLVFQRDGSLLREYPNGNTQSFNWSEEDDVIATPVGSFSIVDDKLTTGSISGREYTCTANG